MESRSVKGIYSSLYDRTRLTNRMYRADGLCRAETAWLSLVIRNSTEKDDKPAKFGAGKWGEKLPEIVNFSCSFEEQK